MSPARKSAERTALYRIFGDRDLLLYVGVSKDFGARWRTHARVQPWWDEMRQQTIRWYESRSEAEGAEAAAIKAEQPKYNIMVAGEPSAALTARRPVPLELAVVRKIKDLRHGVGWSQEQMARQMALLGWPWYGQTLQRIETGNRHIRLGELADLGSIFGVPVEFFFADGDAVSAVSARQAMEGVLREQIAAEIVAAFRPAPSRLLSKSDRELIVSDSDVNRTLRAI